MGSNTAAITETTTNQTAGWHEFRLAAEFCSPEAAEAMFMRACDWFEEQLGHGRFAAACRGPVTPEEPDVW